MRYPPGERCTPGTLSSTRTANARRFEPQPMGFSAVASGPAFCFVNPSALCVSPGGSGAEKAISYLARSFARALNSRLCAVPSKTCALASPSHCPMRSRNASSLIRVPRTITRFARTRAWMFSKTASSYAKREASSSSPPRPPTPAPSSSTASISSTVCTDVCSRRFRRTRKCPAIIWWMRTGPCAAMRNGDPGTVAHDSRGGDAEDEGPAPANASATPRRDIFAASSSSSGRASTSSSCVTANRSAVASHATVNLPTSYATLATSDTTRPSVCSLWYARSTTGANTASAASRNAELTTGNRGA